MFQGHAVIIEAYMQPTNTNTNTHTDTHTQDYKYGRWILSFTRAVLPWTANDPHQIFIPSVLWRFKRQ